MIIRRRKVTRASADATKPAYPRAEAQSGKNDQQEIKAKNGIEDGAKFRANRGTAHEGNDQPRYARLDQNVNEPGGVGKTLAFLDRRANGAENKEFVQRQADAEKSYPEQPGDIFWVQAIAPYE